MASFTVLPAQWETLRRELPDARFRDGSLVVAEVRLVKEPQEVAYQRQAARWADIGLRAALEALRPGLTEVHLAGIVSEALGGAGSEYAAIPPMVASGERSPMVHAMPSRRAISPGDVVIIELAGVCHRYHAVVMRTAVLGSPPRRVADVAACLEEAIEAAIPKVAPGARAGEPEAACNEVLAGMDLVRRRCHRIGYSLGLAYPPTWLEAMFLHETDSHRIAPNMSFTIEPNLTLPDEGFGLKMGDTVLCTDGGGESLSSLGHGLVTVG
jgi:Xaa-Pro dipeptidase